jgi:predicted dithiol-disulfide oxidoreductase (DUF899 family)
MSTATAQGPKIVSQEEWLAARKQLLAKEKKLTRARDALAAERRKLPWVRVEKNYAFDSPNGKKTLAEVFDGRGQLMIYHFMFGPDWEAGCPSCSIVGDHIDPGVTHLANRDVTLVAVSRAALSQIEAFKNRMGWRLKWYSSFGSDFNRDYNVSFTKDEVASQKMYYNYKLQFFPREEGPGASVFHKEHLSYVFDLRTGTGVPDGRLQLARSGAQGPRRTGSKAAPHGLGPPSRSLRERLFRRHRRISQMRRRRA